jgi:alpha-galactosidase
VTGTVYKDHSVVSSFGPSGPTTSPGTLTIAGTTYSKGLGTQQGSDIQYYLGGNCSTLTAVLGVDDSARAFPGSTPTAEFQVVADGAVIFGQTISKGTVVNLNQVIAGAQVIDLIVASGSGFGSTAADWADAYVTCGS